MKKTVLTVILFFSFFLMCLRAGTLLQGTVLGSDGRPMRMANVVVTTLPELSTVAWVTADESGGYSIPIESPGIWIVRFAGVHHRSRDIALYVDNEKTINLDVRLGSYAYRTTFDSVKVNGDYNQWYILRAARMKKNADGTYAAEIPVRKDSVTYRLIYVREDGPIEGTDADTYVFDGTGGYNSVAAAENGRTTLTFNPALLPRRGETGGFEFSGAGARIDSFALRYEELQTAREEFSRAFMKSLRRVGSSAKGVYDWSGLKKTITERIKNETDSVCLRQLYMNLLSISLLEKNSDTSFYAMVLAHVPPSSVEWLLNPHGLYYALSHAAYPDSLREEYVRRVLDGNSSGRVKSALLFDEYHVAKYSQLNDRAKKYYDILVNRYGGTPEAEQIRKISPHELDIMVGKPIPAFSVRSMNDSARTVSNASLKGKYFLVHFWSTTSTASMSGLRYLSEAYAKYGGGNLDIVSMSVDSSADAVRRFIGEKMKMPWTHVFLGNSLEGKVVTDFHVVSVPRLFLVNPEGVLIADDKDLRGEQLDLTLAKYIRH